MIMSKIIEDMLEHASTAPNEEVCGLVIKFKDTNKLKVLRGVNASDNKQAMFDLDPAVWVEAEDLGCEPVAIYHSHPSGDVTPSTADKVTCELVNLPFYIVSARTGDANYFEPCGFSVPYKGRVFYHGVLDCYALVRDWYAREFQIELPNYHRDWEWWDRGQNLYVENFEANDFFELKEGDEPKVGDLIYMQLGSKVPNHAAVYIGKGLILQHVRDRLSSIEVYGGMWLKNTTHRLRHKSRS